MHCVADVGAELFIARAFFLDVRCTFAWGAEVSDEPQSRFAETQRRTPVVTLCLPDDAFDCLQLRIRAPAEEQTPLVTFISENVDRY